MKRFVYIRVSTERQSYERQDYIIKDYFARNGINPDSITAIVKEKVSTRKDIEERGFMSLMDSCDDGDYIYAAGLDRIGRTQLEMMELIEEATKRGIYIIACDEDRVLEMKTDTGRILMSLMTALANVERNRISARTKATLASYKEQIDKHGYFISKDGNRCERLGREKGCDLTKAQDAASKKRMEEASLWRQNSKAYNTVKRWYRQGWSKDAILSEFSELHQADKEFCTRKGGCLSLGMLNLWITEFNKAV